MQAIEATNKILKDLRDRFSQIDNANEEFTEVENGIRFLGTSWAVDEKRLDCLKKAVCMENSDVDVTRIMDVANELYDNKEEMSQRRMEKLASLVLEKTNSHDEKQKNNF